MQDFHNQRLSKEKTSSGNEGLFTNFRSATEAHRQVKRVGLLVINLGRDLGVKRGEWHSNGKSGQVQWIGGEGGVGMCASLRGYGE